MALGVHNFTDLVNLQTVCKSTDLQVYKSIDSPCQNMDFVFAFSIPGKIAACTKHNCGRNMLKHIVEKFIRLYCLSYEYEYQKFTRYILVPVCSPCLLGRKYTYVCNTVSRLITLFIV